MNATKLRADLYAVLDSVLQTGKPVTIERKGRKLRISVEPPQKKRARRKWPKPRPELINGDPDDILKIDWMANWNPSDNLP